MKPLDNSLLKIEIRICKYNPPPTWWVRSTFCKGGGAVGRVHTLLCAPILPLDLQFVWREQFLPVVVVVTFSMYSFTCERVGVNDVYIIIINIINCPIRNDEWNWTAAIVYKNIKWLNLPILSSSKLSKWYYSSTLYCPYSVVVIEKLQDLGRNLLLALIMIVFVAERWHTI